MFTIPLFDNYIKSRKKKAFIMEFEMTYMICLVGEGLGFSWFEFLVLLLLFRNNIKYFFLRRSAKKLIQFI